MFHFSQPVIDIMSDANAVEGNQGMFLRALAFGELDAVIGQDRMNFVGNGFEQMFEKLFCQQARGSPMQFGVSELAGSVDGDKQV